MKSLRNVCVFFSLCVLTFALGACSTTSPEAKNYFNTFIVQVKAPPDRTTAAAKQAVEEMKMENVTAASTKVDGKVRAHTALHDEVEIDIEQKNDGMSEMQIRIGDAGDKEVSRQIWERVLELVKK